MIVNCIWEHNGNDTLLYIENYPGAFTRGECLAAALNKVKEEINNYCCWAEMDAPLSIDVKIVQDISSTLDIRDADSDALFESEKGILTKEKYEELKALCLKSADDFLKLYHAIPDKDLSLAPPRKTFYGTVPSTANEMYEHTKSVNSYYFGEIGVVIDNDSDILDCRKRGFVMLERTPDFLENHIFNGSYGEQWTLKKMLRRFIWHDRIHAKAMKKLLLNFEK